MNVATPWKIETGRCEKEVKMKKEEVRPDREGCELVTPSSHLWCSFGKHNRRRGERLKRGQVPLTLVSPRKT